MPQYIAKTLHELSEGYIMSDAPDNKYGTTPYSPETTSAHGNEPRSSKLTKSLVWPLLVLNVITSVLGIIHLRGVDQEQYYSQALPPEQAQDLTPETLEAMHLWTTVSFIGFAALAVILFLIVGLGLRATKTWARFMGLVLAILFIVSEGFSLLFSVDYGQLATIELVNAIISWVAILVTVWWIVQAMTKSTAQWFAMHRRLHN